MSILRCEALAARGLMHVVHPDGLGGDKLANAVLQQLERRENGAQREVVDMAGLRRITRRVRRLLYSEQLKGGSGED